MLIEPITAYHDAVLREVGMFWPRRFDGVAAVRHPDALHKMSADLRRVNLDAGKFGDRTWRQDVAARLVARTAALLDDSDVVAGARQPCSDARSAWTAADDEDISGDGSRRARHEGQSVPKGCVLANGDASAGSATARDRCGTDPRDFNHRFTDRDRLDCIVGGKNDRTGCDLFEQYRFF